MKTLLNKAHKADCKEILLQLPDHSIDCFLQDPPFEVTGQSWDTGFIKQLPELWPIWKRKAKPNAAFIFKATFPFAIDLCMSNRADLRYEWLWSKNIYTNMVNAKHQPMRCVEYLFVFYSEMPTYTPVLRKNKSAPRKRTSKNKGSTNIHEIRGTKADNYVNETGLYGQPTNLITIPHEKSRFDSTKGKKGTHPNRTNPKVWEYMLKTYTKPGDIVFDGYSGSGSVAEACISLARDFICCENDAIWFPETESNIIKAKELKKFGYAKTKTETKAGAQGLLF